MADKASMKYDILSTEQMLAILKQRKLELEADHFQQDMENALATALDMPNVVESTSVRRQNFADALALLDEQIELLEDGGSAVAATAKARTRRSPAK